MSASTETIGDKMEQLKCCVLIPTYNNQKTLKNVIEGVLEITNHIVIVNDGATDNTSQILREYPKLQQLHFSKNKGKGAALNAGFKKAYALGYIYAITIDSDGQHYPDDLQVFVNEIEKTPGNLLIGDRNMNQEGIPGSSSFGNKFSSFWYRIETGIRLQDTQSGYRLYPLEPLQGLKFYTSKFEFEIEVIVRAAWKEIPVRNVPVKVLYDMDERVSHFRPFKDFTRISILNTVLVVIAFFWIKPIVFFRNIKKKGIKKTLVDHLIKNTDSNLKKALAIALGIFVGISPFWGGQTILVLFLASVFKLNRAIAFTFSNVSLPPFIPFIIYGSLELGALLLGQKNTLRLSEIDKGFDIKKNLMQYVVGSLSLATIMAILFGVISFFLLLKFKKEKINE